jgi:hypothetical protein
VPKGKNATFSLDPFPIKTEKIEENRKNGRLSFAIHFQSNQKIKHSSKIKR